jgi:hypothetical protein
MAIAQDLNQRWSLDFGSRAQGSLAAAGLPHRQPLLLVEAVELLPVHRDTLPLQEKM